MSPNPEDTKGVAPPDEGAAFKGVGSHIDHSIGEFVPKLIATACKITDVTQGRDQLIKLTNSAFGSKYGSIMERLSHELAALEPEYQFTSGALEDARSAEAITPEHLDTSKANHGRDAEDYEETRFGEWQMRHKIETILLSAALPIALGASAYTAWANLVGTGLPVFIDNGLLPISMAAVVPMASFSLKTIWHSLRSEWAKQSFTKALNCTSAGLIATWAFLFADQFHGLGAGPITGGLFDEPGAWAQIREIAFTAVTLLAEMAIGTALAHRLDKIAARYSPNYGLPNPESESVQSRIERLTLERDLLLARMAELSGELKSYAKSLDLQVDLAVLIYDARRSADADDTL